MGRLEKVIDSGTVPGRSRVDQSWMLKKPQILFSPNNKNVRQGTQISQAYLNEIRDTDHIPDFLVKHYHIKGFEFGNWTTEEDRQNYLIGLSIALYDLQQLLGFEKHQIGLNGKLSICFGSRGVPHASAHFDFGNFLINLSRYDLTSFKELNVRRNDGKSPKRVDEIPASSSLTEYRKKLYLKAMLSRGLQSLVHEYGHALDYYCGTYAEHNPYNCLSTGETSWKTKIEIDQQKFPLAYQMNVLLNKICFDKDGKPSKFIVKQDAHTGRRKYYYGQRNELFARAFEKYVNYKMKRKGWFNVYFSKFKHVEGKDNTTGSDVYMKDTEFAAVEKEFDKLISLIKKSIKGTKGLSGSSDKFEAEALEMEKKLLKVKETLGDMKPYQETEEMIYGLPDDLKKPTKVRLVYSRIKGDDIKITSSKDAVDALRNAMGSEIELREKFIILLLNRANKVLGYFKVSEGGIVGTVVDVRMIMAAAVEAQAVSIILCHNHPSGNTHPSEADIKLTKKIKEAGAIMDISVLDHVILTTAGYFSFADEGML